MSIGAVYLTDAAARFQQYKTQAEQAIAQVSDADLFRALGPESNSIAVLMQHIAGTMRSRWVDFLTTDGEKPNRHRDREFETPPVATRAAILADWESAWALLFKGLGELRDVDLERTVTARHEPMPVLSAINRQIGHAAVHIGQILMLAKHFKGADWKTMTIPKGQSEQYNQMMKEKYRRER